MSTTSATMTKVTSPGSQYSVSSSPSVPFPTPVIEALDSAVVDPPPPMDFNAVVKILDPIQETLNESAAEAMYPSPPINTPEVMSPSPSVYRYPIARSRGFSAIGDRLAQLKIDERKYNQRETDAISSSRSIEHSIAEDEGSEAASVSEVLSDSGKDKQGPNTGSMSSMPLTPLESAGSVPIALGSPTVNPRIVEYLSFSSKDLPTKAATPPFQVSLEKKGSASTKTAIGKSSSCGSFKSDGGVTEKSNWAEEVEDAVVRTCMRLEQLAADEHATNPSKPVEVYYVDRLKRLLGDHKRAHPVKIQLPSDDST